MNSRKAPDEWTGWPDGKKFAFIITHDVETAEGQEKVKKLAQIDQEFGLRSSFNFIPERYAVSSELRHWLQGNGFEVGVHDLNHDGKLYFSRKLFEERSIKINRYIEEWNAKGFRSGAMFHNLEWIGLLNIDYDSSTFDTDPFEPQPDAVGTIFPFYVIRDNGKPFIELPYTLAQDFLLFVIFKEKTISLWKNKLDWIARNGGMALINVHPDYINFGDEKPRRERYPLELYRQFLTYCMEEYSGEYWHRLPRQLADYCLSNYALAPSAQTEGGENRKTGCLVKKKHILFIVENNPAPPDARVWNEALAAKEFGYEVSIISPFDNLSNDNRTLINGIHIYRHPRPPEKSTKWALILEYINATIWECLLSIRIYLTRPFDLIHAANPPDHVFLIAIPFKLFGVKYLFDHHDITPETYVAKFGKRGIVFRLLLFMEWLTFKTANLVISTNESYAKLARERGGKKHSEVVVVRNGPDLSRIPHVAPNPRLKNGFNYLIGYVGIIGQQEGIENLLKAVQYIVQEKKRTDIKFIIVGSGPHLKSIIAQSSEMGVEQFIQFTGYLTGRELFEVLETSDICVNPEYGNEYTDKSTMIKLMEYMTFGKPIIQFYTKEGEVTAGNAALYVRENDTTKFADAIIALLNDPSKREEMGAIGRKRIEETLGWAQQKEYLKSAYRKILSM